MVLWSCSDLSVNGVAVSAMPFLPSYCGKDRDDAPATA